MGERVEVNHSKSVIFWRLVRQAFICLGSAVGTLVRGVEFLGKLAVRAPERCRCWLLIYFAFCSGVSFVDFKQVTPTGYSCSEADIEMCFNKLLFYVCWYNPKLVFAGFHLLVKLQAFGILLCRGMNSLMAISFCFNHD